MPSALRSHAGRRVISMSPQRTVPLRGESLNPMMARSSVVLPTPLRPRIATARFESTSSVAPWMTYESPRDTCRSWIARGAIVSSEVDLLDDRLGQGARRLPVEDDGAQVHHCYAFGD